MPARGCGLAGDGGGDVEMNENGAMIGVTKMMLATLKEMAGYPNKGQYWFRQASCKRLAELGLAEPHGWESCKRKRKPYRITAKGFEFLASLKKI
jgi:hypothetical protein